MFPGTQHSRCYPRALSALFFGIFALGMASASGFAAEEEIVIGQAAPDFSLQDQNGTNRSLTDLRGHWLVLYFYPKDDTPGCTTEACQFRDDYVAVKQLGGEILGVSIDNRDSHAEFARKYQLPFPLLVDVDGRVAKQYGALWGFWPLRITRRHTFIVDPQGRVAKIYRKVDPKTHSREVIADVQALQQAAGR